MMVVSLHRVCYFPLYHGENKICVDKMMIIMSVVFYIVLNH